jgi:hypothetical protein
MNDVRFAVHHDILTGAYTTLQDGSEARCVNEQNQVAGEANFNGVWSGAFWANPDAPPVELPPLVGDDVTDVYDMNDAGIIVGDSRIPGASVTGVIWQAMVDEDSHVSVDGPVAMPPLPGDVDAGACGVNEPVDGVAIACGWSRPAGGETGRAVVWFIELDESGCMMTPIADPIALGAVGQEDWYPIGISNIGDVCGVLCSSRLPVLAPVDGSPEFLPITRAAYEGTTTNINDAGVVVGWLNLTVRPTPSIPVVNPRASIWENGEVSLLQDKVRDKAWGNLSYANAINNAGVVGGRGSYVVDGSTRGFIMIPSSP